MHVILKIITIKAQDTHFKFKIGSSRHTCFSVNIYNVTKQNGSARRYVNIIVETILDYLGMR